MQGLARLSCLIHDSQADKKAFVEGPEGELRELVAGSGSEARETERRAKAAAIRRRAPRTRTASAT